MSAPLTEERAAQSSHNLEQMKGTKMKYRPIDGKPLMKAMYDLAVAQVGVKDAARKDNFNDVLSAIIKADEEQKKLDACVLSLSKTLSS